MFSTSLNPCILSLFSLIILSIKLVKPTRPFAIGGITGLLPEKEELSIFLISFTLKYTSELGPL